MFGFSFFFLLFFFRLLHPPEERNEDAFLQEDNQDAHSNRYSQQKVAVALAVDVDQLEDRQSGGRDDCHQDVVDHCDDEEDSERPVGVKLFFPRLSDDEAHD